MVTGAGVRSQDPGVDLLTWGRAEAIFSRPPSLREVAETFPEEIRQIVPRRLRLASQALKAMEELLAPNLEEVPEEDRPTAWLLLRLTYRLDELQARVERYRRLWHLAKKRQRRGGREVDVAEIKQRTDIVEICRELGIDLRPGGRYWRARCPFPDHEDREPSFFVDPASQRYVCYGCDRHGDVIQLLRELKGLSFWEALRELEVLR